MGKKEVLDVLRKNKKWMTTLEVFKAGKGYDRAQSAKILRKLSDSSEVLERKRKQYLGNQFKTKHK